MTSLCQREAEAFIGGQCNGCVYGNAALHRAIAHAQANLIQVEGEMVFRQRRAEGVGICSKCQRHFTVTVDVPESVIPTGSGTGESITAYRGIPIVIGVIYRDDMADFCECF